jgi:hypothetical protein
MRDQDLTSKEPADEIPEAAGQDIQSAARRRWILRGGVSIAPVVLTLTSRPVLGGMTPNACIAPSVTMSGALSHATKQMGNCSGQSCSWWLSQSSWPGIGKSGSFHSIFTVGNRSGCRFFTTAATSLTLSQVMNLGSTSGTADSAGNFDQDKVAANMIASYLNILSGTVDSKAMTLDRLQALWREWAINGSYTPYAGATPWTSSGIKSYLSNNKISP